MPSRRSALVVLVIALLFPLSGCGQGAGLPHSTTEMDVTWSTSYSPGGPPLGTAGHRHLTGQAVTTIVDWLNGLPSSSSPDNCDACPYPLFYQAHPVFTFHVAAGTAVFAYEDNFRVVVTINGRHKRTLAASTDFESASEAFMRDVLHVPAPSPS